MYHVRMYIVLSTTTFREREGDTNSKLVRFHFNPYSFVYSMNRRKLTDNSLERATPPPANRYGRSLLVRRSLATNSSFIVEDYRNTMRLSLNTPTNKTRYLAARATLLPLLPLSQVIPYSSGTFTKRNIDFPFIAGKEVGTTNLPLVQSDLLRVLLQVIYYLPHSVPHRIRN